MKRDPLRGLKRVWYQLKSFTSTQFSRFGRQTDEIFSEEPIDFSAPSIPYYENLANRLSFVRVVLYLVLFVFIVVTVVSNHRLITYENLYFLAKDIGAATLTAQSEADRLSYPVSATEVDFATYRGGLAVAGSDVVTVLSGSGRKTLSVNVDYAAPVIRTSDQYILTFGRGEDSFAVYNAFVQVHRESTEFPVYDAAVGDNGNFAVLTRSRDYTSEILLYDSNMEPLAAYRLGGYVTGLAMNPAGTCLGVVSLESRAGVTETQISLIRIGDRITRETVTLSGTAATLCGFTSDDRFAVILTDRLMTFKTDATVSREIFFDDREPLLGTIDSRRIAILFRDRNDLSTEHLVTYDGNGDRLHDIALVPDHPIRRAGGMTRMAFGEETLFLCTDTAVFRLAGNGSTLTAAAVSRDTLALLPLDGREARVCTPAYAYRLTESDFGSPEAVLSAAKP